MRTATQKVFLPALFLFGAASSLHAVTVVDIQKGYSNERKYIDELIASIKTADENQVAAIEVAKTGAANQVRSQGNAMTTDKQTQLLQKQMANYTKMEIQRSESVALQSKELIFEVWKLSSNISRDELVKDFGSVARKPGSKK